MKIGAVGNRYKNLLVDKRDKTRLSAVGYLNARPVLYGLLQEMGEAPFHLDLADPAELSRRLIEDEADAALAPVATLAQHGALEVVPGIAIACDGAVASVLVVGECPFEEIETLLVDASSRTSVILARLLLRARTGKEPKIYTRAPAEIPQAVQGRTAGLLIGDLALSLRGRFSHELDLGAAWKEWTDLPFVFAVWAAKANALTEHQVNLLTSSLEAGLSARAPIATRWAEENGGKKDHYLHYLTHNIQYRLDDRTLAGLAEFLRRAAEAKLLPAHTVQLYGSAPSSQNIVPAVDVLLAKATRGGRLSFHEAMRLGADANTHDLGLAADMRRKTLHPAEVVTYIVDRNINYTNVCTTSCRFCAFYRPVGHAEGYVLSREVLGQKIQETVDAGGIQILLQGGLNPDLRLQWYEDLFRWMKESYSIALHALSPEEIWHLARLENLSLRQVLARLQKAGMDSLPGGGAEVLTDRVRSKIAKAKCTSAEWLDCMRAAHELGMKSTATMMFGTADTLLDRVAHMLKVRDLQDETGGFTAFISWDYQHEQGTRHIAGETGTVLYLRMQALSRLVLDNIPNIQTSWVTQGPGVGQLGLRYGANDMGSVMFEENVVSSAGTTFGMDAATIETHARAAGFKVARRNMRYELLNIPY